MGFGFYWKPAEYGLKALKTVALMAYALSGMWIH